MKISRSILVGASLLALGGVPALAQQVTGVPGSPEATTTIDGKQIPPPDPKFGGVINERASESRAWWAPRVVPPKGAPNVLLKHSGIMKPFTHVGHRGSKIVSR